jgi:hypothetical protein
MPIGYGTLEQCEQLIETMLARMPDVTKKQFLILTEKQFKETK